MDNEPKKPTLHLLDSRDLTPEKLLDFYRALTGREPTPEQVEAVSRRLAKWRREDEPDPGEGEPAQKAEPVPPEGRRSPPGSDPP